MKNDAEQEDRWWQSLGAQECPITLELFSTLPYPPFDLRSGATETISYFDGLALASYIVSRGIFQNPLTRQELTMDDCRRLDDYLERYCYKQQQQQQQGLSSSRKIAVAEAYALRASVHVKEPRDGAAGQQQQQANNSNRRAQALRSTATAALAGLFVYGNDRRGARQEEQEDYTTAPMTACLPREDQLILDWGFDLTKTVDNTAEFDDGGGGGGWTVIDDDEAIVVASQREAYQTTQNAFPRLSDCSAEQPAAATAAASMDIIMDAHLVQRVRELSVFEQQQEARRARQSELTQQHLLLQALQRRQERKEAQEKQLAQGTAQYIQKQKDEEETRRARAEIEAWREDQWEKLRLLSKAQQQQQIGKREQKAQKPKRILSNQDATKEAESSSEPHQTITTGPTPEELLTDQKKAKAAAKRKRAKERQKSKKAEERTQLEEKKQEQAHAAKKAAAALQCAACGQGILDCGFEKFELTFCSPKCARTATPKR
jgi:hypothetical protein